MGVDPHKPFYVVIGCRIDQERYEIVKVTAVAEWPDVHDLARRFNVRSGVADIRPYEDSGRAFQKTEGYPVFLAQYTESSVQDIFYSTNEFGRPDLVKANRTQIFDRSHRLLTEKKIILPRLCSDINEFISQCCSAAKMLEKNEKTGEQIYRYRKVGNKGDHYRNALNYFLLAAAKAPVVAARGRYGKRKPKTEYAII